MIWGESFTHKLEGTVVGKELLDVCAPVDPELQHPVFLWGDAHVTAPRLHLLQLLKCPWAHQEVQAVLTEASASKSMVRIWGHGEIS